MGVMHLRQAEPPAGEHATAVPVRPPAPIAAGVAAAAHAPAAPCGPLQLRADIALGAHGQSVDEPRAAPCFLLSNISWFACRVANVVNDGSSNVSSLRRVLWPRWACDSARPAGLNLSALGAVRRAVGLDEPVAYAVRRGQPTYIELMNRISDLPSTEAGQKPGGRQPFDGCRHRPFCQRIGSATRSTIYPNVNAYAFTPGVKRSSSCASVTCRRLSNV
jgi:hypothetical protein